MSTAIDALAARLKKDAERELELIRRLVSNPHEMCRLQETDPQIIVHEWHPNLAKDRAGRYKPQAHGIYICPKCFVLSGYVNELSIMGTLIDCASCDYKIIVDPVGDGLARS